ncbi:NB-ARC domain-containing protein [Aphanothece sacrum]|uniref:WD40 repeat-containing protein n=1 Tax=Aphanothece sacrum FPU1 TaxID=1920663 RepID=A0A401IFY9_APHSA|nr:NB-ARC domain-containing protein [Aphanothece sacrum]GBF80100.1 WD40 repeat-containing protein [Aphanothece sacrum FPU1]GBF86062.1 WD repeat-containing protein [Aphanothece sacrum FPU3]
MDCEVAIQHLKERLKLTLNAAQETVFRGAWEGKTYEQISSESLDFPNVKYLSNDIGPNLWHILSERLAEKIGKGNFRAVLESHFSNVDQGITLDTDSQFQESPSGLKIDWGEAPNVSMIRFYEEREQQMTELKTLILQHQLVAQIGLNGIGKTAVAVKLVEQLIDEGKFELIIWRSLSYNPPPNFEKTLRDLLNFLHPNENFKLFENNGQIDVNQNLSLLIDCLRKKRCLLVLDHVEFLMKKGEYAGNYLEGYQQYGELWERVGKERHQSCLLIITQEKPIEVSQLEERGFSVASYILKGLKEDIKKNFEQGGLSNPERWDELIDIFKGHPFALQNVANKIKQIFGGNVVEYLKEHTITRRDIDEMLAQEITFLSLLERRIVFFLSTFSSKQDISFSELKQKLIELNDESNILSGAELQDALESLLQRSLILGEKKYRIDPIVQKYILNKPKNPLKQAKKRENSREVDEKETIQNLKETIKILEDIFQKS